MTGLVAGTFLTELEPVHLVGIGGALGAWARHWLAGVVDHEEFPVGTLAVNVLGTFVFALLVFAGANSEWLLLLGVGACGSFTTFSSFSYETVRLWETGEPIRATVNAAGNLLCCLVAAGAAWALVGIV